jgi:hypothetical protein
MLRRSILLAIAAIVVSLGLSAKAQAWGAYHVGYTHYSPYTGLHHYGYTGVHAGGYGGYGGYHYGGYHYGGYGGGYHYGYYRRW